MVRGLFIILVGLIVASNDAEAQGIEITRCKPDFSADLVSCSVTNSSETAIAAIDYYLEIGETGRTIPWGEAAGSLTIPGGIEPGEAVTLNFAVPDLPHRARFRELDWRFLLAVPLDLDRNPILPTSEAPLIRPAARPSTAASTSEALPDRGPPLTPDERAAFLAAVQDCWDVRTLSPEAARVSVVVVFGLTRDGQVTGGIRLLNIAGSAQTSLDSAFDVARSAIRRCQGDGYRLPLEKYEHWRRSVLIFDAERMAIR